MKSTALFELFPDGLGQPMVLVPGGGNGDAPVKGFPLPGRFNIGSGSLSEIVPFAFMDTT